MDFDRILALFRAMNEEGVDYAVFGALALSAHGIVRATVDADVFVRPTADNVEALKRALRRVWNDPEIDEMARTRKRFDASLGLTTDGHSEVSVG